MAANISRRILMFASAALLCGSLSGCGFQPLYANGDSGLGTINIAPIDGRIGYFIGQNLNRKFETSNPSKPRLLKVEVKTTLGNAALGQNSYTVRTIVTANVTYKLEAGETGAAINGAFSETSGYDVLGNAYGEVALGAQAEEKLAAIISDKIWFDILRQSRKK